MGCWGKRSCGADSALAIVHEDVDWALQVGLHSACLHIRLDPDIILLRSSISSLAIQLILAGWIPVNDAAADIVPGGELVYRPFWSQPVSYSACLPRISDVFERRVERVQHGGYDTYYRCLLASDSAAAKAMLLNMHDKGSDWFRKLVKGNPADESAGGPDHGVDVPVAAVPDMEPVPGVGCHIIPQQVDVAPRDRFQRAVPDMRRGLSRSSCNLTTSAARVDRLPSSGASSIASGTPVALVIACSGQNLCGVLLLHVSSRSICHMCLLISTWVK